MSKNGILLFFLIVILVGLVAGLSQHLLKFKTSDSTSPQVLGESIKVRDEIVFVSDRLGQSGVYLLNSDNQSLKLLAFSQGGKERAPVLSPDKKSLAFWAQEGIYSVLYLLDLDLSNSEKKVVTATKNFPYFISFSPSARKLVYLESTSSEPKDSNLYLVDIASGSVTEIARQADFPSWSADSKEIIYVKNFGEELADREIAGRRLDNLGQLEPEETLFKGGSWPIQDNERLIILNKNPSLELAYLDKVNKRVDSIASLALPETEFYLSAFQLSPQGDFKLLLGVYSLGSRSEIWLFDFMTKGLKRAVNDGFDPLWSNDGQKIIFTRLKSPERTEAEIWQFDLENSRETKLTGNYSAQAPVNSFLGRSNTLLGQRVSQKQSD